VQNHHSISRYDVVEAIYDPIFHSFVVVMRNRGDDRLVVAFRGSSSKKQWLNNLRFNQVGEKKI